MALTITKINESTVLGSKYRRAVFNITFDSSYPVGGEAIDLSAYDFNYVVGISSDNSDDNYGVILDGTKASGVYTASSCVLKAVHRKALEVSGTVAHDATLFDAAGLTDSAVLFQQPAGSNIVGIKIGVGAAFVATSMTALTMEVGDGSDADGYFNGTIDLVADAVGTTDTTKGVLFVPTVYSPTAQDWTGTATAVGADLSTTSAGSMTYAYYYYPEGANGIIGGPGIEVAEATDLSTESFTVVVEGY